MKTQLHTQTGSICQSESSDGEAITITRTTLKGEKYEVQINQCDLPLYQRYQWQRHTKGLIRYHGQRKGQGSVLFYREIMGVGPELYVVHRNGNKFDCRRSNLEVITYAEQRQRGKLNPSIRTLHKGRPTGVAIVEFVHRWANGKTSTYRQARAHFCHRRKERAKGFSIDVYGLEEARRRALAWRVEMIRNHSMEPNPELLDMLSAKYPAPDGRPPDWLPEGGDQIDGQLTVNGQSTDGLKRRGNEEEEETKPPNPQGGDGEGEEDPFDRFWAAYPSKVGKGKAREEFKRQKCAPLLGVILEAVARQKTWEKWCKENGRYVPNPSTWLHQHRWEDEGRSEGSQPKGRGYLRYDN